MRHTESEDFIPTPDALLIYNDEARQYFCLGYEDHLSGSIDTAIHFYKRSLAIVPNAPALTYLGWAYSMNGDYEAAIEWCKKSINLEPRFGNSYNDVGAYMMQLGRDLEAIGWFHNAIRAEIYSFRHYPYFNLGRIYERQGQIKKAREAYRQSLCQKSDFKLAIEAYERLSVCLN